MRVLYRCAMVHCYACLGQARALRAWRGVPSFAYFFTFIKVFMTQNNYPVKNINIGRFGEALASKFLRERGYKILKSNYFIRGGELDLITQKDAIIVFVEVKTRISKNFGSPEEACTARKKHTLLRTIYTYLADQTCNHPAKLWRCDLIAIQFTGSQKATIKHYQNIFSD